jgi:hypothetical protein
MQSLLSSSIQRSVTECWSELLAARRAQADANEKHASGVETPLPEG